MHSFARHRISSAGKASAKETQGLIGSGGWRHDLMEWFIDTFLFRGQLRQLRQRTATLARIQPGEQVLDVGCGTGTLAMEVARRVGRAGRVAGIDPGTEQIARARRSAARRPVPIEFQIGVIEQLAFPDQTFDVVLSTLMMHHLHGGLKRQGLAEIARVLKPGGRLVIADFKRKQERAGQAARFHAASSPFFGNVYLCWASFRSDSHGNASPQPLVVATSTDGGTIWTQKQVTSASNNPFNPKQGFGRSGCTVRSDSYGVVYVFAEQFAVGTPGQDSQIMVKSFDGGKSWTRPVNIGLAVDTCFLV
jgi:ubiquinone/menaquinone biosynthesis C-methylase UbiE